MFQKPGYVEVVPVLIQI